MKPLTNKQVAVLELLRAEGELSAKRIAALISERTLCATCGGTGDGDAILGVNSSGAHRCGCRFCYGRGRMHFGYGTAYAALVRLEKAGLVERQQERDRWGDKLPGVLWRPVAVVDPDDPLEAAFRAPSAPGYPS